MTTTVEPFEIPITIAPDDIDQLGHVNNIVYLRWVQEIAITHWQAAAPAADQAQLIWVIVRHEIDYKRPAYLGDKLIARTWVGPASRRAFERHTEFLRAADQSLLAKARTVWCPLDRQTGQVTDVSPEVRALFSVQERL